PPLNLFDALASDFSDCFTTTPDYRPYRCVPVDPRIFDPEKAKDPKDPDYGQARKLPSPPMDDPDEMENVLRRGEREARPGGGEPSRLGDRVEADAAAGRLWQVEITNCDFKLPMLEVTDCDLQSDPSNGTCGHDL